MSLFASEQIKMKLILTVSNRILLLCLSAFVLMHDFRLLGIGTLRA